MRHREPDPPIKMFYTLGEIAARGPMLAVACNRCDRHGLFRADKLLARLGPDFPGPMLGPVIAADCPKVLAGNLIYDRCGVHFPRSARPSFPPG